MPTKKKPQVTAAAARRRELLETAAEVFAEQGYNATTVRKIADHAGMLAGSLYYHFDSKESMLEEILRTFLDELWGGYDAVLGAELQYHYANGGGVIVNNASVLGWRAQEGQAHYAAAKAGVMALTRCAAIEAAAHGVRVNAVAPSLAMHPHLAKVTTEELLAELTAREAFGRYAEPWEVANVIVFLASDYSSYLAGEIVSVSSQHP